ncbi:MAG: bifunctional metallophosphatase/5'-nucleotidase [Bacteriovorax sp.]
MSWKFFSILFIGTLSLLNSSNSEARLIQILHTNDTHSFLDGTDHNNNLGGAARLKSLIDYYKNKAAEEGIKSVVMDAGDFTEGNLYYMADNGRKVFDIHNEMGYDIGAIGNHDYLMGTRDLDKILGEMDLKFSLLAANLQMNLDYKNIREKIRPYKELEIDGIKIGVLGLTTNEIFYKWRFEGGQVINPFKSAKFYEGVLKRRKNDFIIALTHIGVLNDIKLAERSKYIDLIIGGHSHTALFQPSYGINKNKQPVPIVQAGMHTEYLGRLLLNLEKGRPLKVVQYELIPVKYEASDVKIKTMVEEANNDLDTAYGKAWLDEIVGYSDLKADDKDGSRKWAYFITDSLKEKAGADIAIHTPFMNGENFPIGNVSRRDLFNSIPRVFDLTEKYGWDIYTTKIKGVWLRLVFEALTHFGQPLTFSGLKMEYDRTEHGIKIKNRLFVNGKKIETNKYYTVAFTEGIVRGAQGVSPYTSSILRNPKNTKYKIWATLEEKVGQSVKGLSLNKISEDNHQLIMPNQNAELVE